MVVTHNGRLAAAHPECAVHNAFGDAYPWALCAGSPAVAEYAAALAAEIAALDVVADVELEACGWYGYDHLSAHDKTGGTPAGPARPVAGRLLLRELRGHAAGGRGGLRGHRGRGPGRPGRLVSDAVPPELAGALSSVRAATAAAFLEHVVAAVRAAAPASRSWCTPTRTRPRRGRTPGTS